MQDGEWFVMSGHGQFICENGDVYEGEFKDLKRHGFGFQRWASGQQFRGFWKNDRYVSGVYRDERGRVFRGDFKRGRVERIYGSAGDELAFTQDTNLPPVNALRSDTQPFEENPAPKGRGRQLEADPYRARAGSFKIVRRARRFVDPPPTSPGPAAYKPSTARAGAPRYTFGQKKPKCYFDAKLSESISPGPKYALRSTLRPKTSACIRERAVNPDVVWTSPGPGSHVHDVTPDGARATVGGGPKFGFPRDKSRMLPYENSKAQYISSDFTKRNTTWSSPGPARYTLPSSFQKGNRISIHGRIHALDGPVLKDSKPGPGSHNLAQARPGLRTTTHAFGGERQRKEFHNPNIVSPGPVYNVRSEVCTYPRGYAQISFTN